MRNFAEGSRLAWPQSYFSDDYWVLASAEYSPERTRREAAYLESVLRDEAVQQVTDLCCGEGRHALPLARAGFDVLGVDANASVIDRARRSAVKQDVGDRARFCVADCLTGADWSETQFDAAILIQAFGWGADEDQRTLLREIRRRLRPSGIFILDISPLPWIVRNFLPQASTEINGRRFIFDRAYDAATGRLVGSLSMNDGRSSRLVEHSIRLYTVPDVVTLLGQAGFEVVRIDADFCRGCPVDLDTRYAQFVCRRLPEAPMAMLARGSEVSSSDALDVSWLTDEGDFCDPTPKAVWENCRATFSDWNVARDYNSADPYGARRLAPALSKYMGFPIDPECVVAGAGVMGLLHGIAGAVADGGVALAYDAYPDLAHWVMKLGGRVVHRDRLDLEPAEATMIYIEQPTAAGVVMRTDALTGFAARIAAQGRRILIDESALNYLPREASTAEFAVRTPGVVVLRGFSKGFGAGGVRVGVLIGHPETVAFYRGYIAPGQVATASLLVAEALLSANDLLEPLRKRIARHKPVIADLLVRCGFEIEPSHPGIPWITVVDSDRRFAAAGIKVREIPAAAPGGKWRSRLYLPLSDAATDALAARLEGRP